MKTIHSLTAGILVTALLAGCKRDDQIQTYQAPKDQSAAAPTAPAPGNSMAGMDSQPVPVNSAPVHWTVPTGWKENPPSSVFLGDLDISGPDGKTAKVTITSFPGDVGGVLPNVNRWRQQIGLNDITQPEVTSIQTSVDSSDARLYDITGASERIVVAWVMRDGASWFFKIRGPVDVVTAARPTFLEFLKSVRFEPTVAGAPPADVHAAMPGTDMGSGLPAAPAVSPGALPKWNPPTDWVETPAGMMVTKSYSITDASGQKAAVSISVLGGTGGGTLANVNRWRRQLSLAEITDDVLPQNVKSLDVLGGTAVLVDFTGTGAGGQPEEMVAAGVTHGDQTWFYKLAGPPGLVSKEKSIFLKFVQEVNYP